MPMAILAALLSAFCQALGSVFQRLASMETAAAHGSPGSSGDSDDTELTGTFWSRTWHLVTQPRWLFGLAAMGGTFIFNAIALYFGTLATVQPILVTELLFALGLRVLWLKRPVPARTFISAGVLCAGLVGFLVAARPTEGDHVPSPAAWVGAVGVRLVLVALLAVCSRWGSPTRKAALLGSAAALVWSVDAAFVKQTTTLLSDQGLPAIFVHWPLYAVIVTGIFGTFLLEAALGAGPLVASQSALMIVDPLASILLGIELFGEQLARAPWAIAAQVVALVALCLGVITLARSLDGPSEEAPLHHAFEL